MCFGKKNVGKLDGIVRAVIGAAFLSVGVLYITPPVSYLYLLVGLVLLATAFMRSCPVYQFMDVTTCRGACNLEFGKGKKKKKVGIRKKRDKKKKKINRRGRK